VLLAVAAAPVLADEVVFKNGDRLTGTIVEMTEGELVINTAVAGKVKVKLADVQTFSTDKPVEMRFKDGSRINQPVTKSDQPGSVTAPGIAGAPASSFSLEQVSSINPPFDKWTGSLLVGGMVSFGNTQAQQLNIGLDLERRTEKDRLTFGGNYRFGRQKSPDTGVSSTTTDDWKLFGQYDYFLNEKLYMFGRLDVLSDNIADLNIRFTPSVGVGYLWVDTPRITFRTEAGLGWTYEDYDATGSSDYFSARLAYGYTNKLRDGVVLFHNLEYLPSLEDLSVFKINADLGLRVDLTDAMFAEGKIDWRHYSDPPPATDENDTRIMLSIGWRL
jgi:putative salt-induced outer membrane protein YdiY